MEGRRAFLPEGVPGGEGFSRRSGGRGPDGKKDGGNRFQHRRLAQYGTVCSPGGGNLPFLSGAPKDSTVSVRIGCHTDSLHKLDEWKRVPEITMQVPADRGRVKMVNPMGGLVYVNVGQRSKRGKVFKVQISGAVPAPLFVMGKTTPEQWAEQLENSCGMNWGITTSRLRLRWRARRNIRQHLLHGLRGNGHREKL